ncbi:MAG TPA: PH domain-containing protein [Actinomycetota bacterium]|nr:PH domain-containing protein [Actinomycetota bacterium]
MARSFLAPGEEVVRTTRRHLSVLARPALGTLVSIGLLGAIGWFTGPQSTTDVVDQVCGALAVLLLLRFALRLRRWANERILVTDMRIATVGGLMARRVTSWPFVRIHDLGLRRSITGRILGYGSVVIEARVPGSAPIVLERIPDPNGFYRDVMEVLMEGPLPDMVEVDRDQPDETDEAVARPSEDEADTGPLPRVVV